MLERHRFPGMAPRIQRAAAGVGVEQTVLILPPQFVGPFHDEIEVGIEHQVFVLFPDPQSEAPLLLRQRPPREGLRLALGHHVLPLHRGAFVAVDEAVVVGEAEGDGGRVEAAGEAEAGAGDGRGGAQVELNSVVELVGVDAVDLGDVVVAVGGEVAEDAVEEFQGGEAELRREHRVEEALPEGPHPHYGSHGRPNLLHLSRADV